jgi:UDP-glucose 4-epimerase
LISHRDHAPTLRVVLTGGGEFLGSHVLARLLGAGMDITMIGPNTGESRYAASLVSAETVRFVRCDPDYSDEGALRAAVERADVLVLLGHRFSPRSSVAESILSELDRNVGPIVRLLHASEGTVRHAVFASSVAVYGTPPRVPVRENDPARPTTPYAIAKLTAEQTVRATCSAAGMTATILRYATVYGPGETAKHTVGGLVDNAVSGRPPVIDGDGLDEHDYVHVADAAEATVAALRHRADGVYNIGTGIGTTTLDLARLVTSIANSGASPVCRTWKRPDAPRVRIVCDTLLASIDIGFVARRGLVDGITEEIGWLKAQVNGTAQAVLAPSA